VPPGPRHLLRVPDLQQQVELLGEQRVVVGQGQAEQRERLGERPPADDQVDPAAGDEVEGGELLEHPHRVGGAEHVDRAAQPDARGAGRRGGQDDRRRRVVVLRPVVLADAEGVEAHLVGEGDLLEQVGHPLLGADHVTRRRIGHRRDEAVDAEVHGVLPES
jgi:hypothetical protein